MRRKSNSKSKMRNGKNVVNVTQRARARSGQGGNVFAINASDVGVIRTDIAPK